MKVEKSLSNMMMDYNIHKGSFLNVIEQNSFSKIQTTLQSVIFHVRGLEIFETQRE